MALQQPPGWAVQQAVDELPDTDWPTVSRRAWDLVEADRLGEEVEFQVKHVQVPTGSHDVMLLDLLGGTWHVETPDGKTFTFSRAETE